MMRRILSNAIIYGLPLPVIFISLLIGSSDNIGFSAFWDWISATLDGSNSAPLVVENVIFNIRIPRALMTFLVGAALATSGGVLQAIFRNPLVDPYILGISSGAAFGASLAILIPLLSVHISAFIFGAAAVSLTYVFGYTKNSSSITIILAGMIVSGLFTASLALVQYLSDPFKLQAIVQWTMGSLHLSSWHKVQQSVIPISAGLLGLYLIRWKLNLLSLGDEEARAVGVNPVYIKVIAVILATMVTAVAVASAGIISLYGLFVPHITRMLVGASNTKTTPANIFFGGTFLLIIDNFCRTIFPYEIPIGIFTMIIGAPFFIFLIKKRKINWT
ncbi:FecCD family ABC transporter permease [Pedobacter sp. KBW06]|uniref:FecCD family ABC transporter permease n=1 Tax=Pedobacter sp. KBW06 TaxID=2153359 RepID=UPI001F3370D5|nr:iron ABC transporter permease [Pedobacter sp. KBW06]